MEKRTVSPSRNVRVRHQYPFSSVGCTGSPLTVTVVCFDQLGWRTRKVKVSSFGSEKVNVESPLFGTPLRWVTVPLRNRAVEPINRFTVRLSSLCW